MAQAAALLVSATLFAIMFALGLSLAGDRLNLVRERPALFARVLLGTCVLVPLLALLLLKLPLSAALTPSARFAIALMAVCPSAPLALRKAGKATGSRQLASQLQVSAAVLAILSIPLLADVFTQTYGISGWDIGPKEVALQIGKAQLLPLACGMLLRRWWPGWAQRWEGLFDKLANGLLLLLIVAVLVKTGHQLVPFLSRSALALGFMAVMVVASLAIGHLLAGNDPEERTTTALVTSMRNPGLALLLASTYASGMAGLKLAILSYLLLTVLLSVPYLRWRKTLSLRGAS
ncbi:bile acid:sodium symporter family protein [Cyanobium sp. Morenito 9A2]|uniref:bile acid:sodium symporter family protein n=1 Tax=Cyanobium sp. Morenito 9A2 TaxID=2823718 RepID=UPI0020CDCFCD|nr:bile acid:sodium symporter [Cyanobium sp. Morenito 9A2]MCP9848857.1 bile acid:sodium symporter [Cyanobium sp. Morenito 9A2]